MEYEILLSQKLSSSLVDTDTFDQDTSECFLSEAVATILSEFLAVSIGTIYQPDLFYLTMPLLVHAIKQADYLGRKFRISSEPPAVKGRKRFGESAIYEIIDPEDYKLRVLVELRTDQAPCPLRSVLTASHEALQYRKAGLLMLAVAVSTAAPVKVAEVSLRGEGLDIQKIVEFSLITVRPRKINRTEAAEFVRQLSQWLVTVVQLPVRSP